LALPVGTVSNQLTEYTMMAKKYVGLGVLGLTLALSFPAYAQNQNVAPPPMNGGPGAGHPEFREEMEQLRQEREEIFQERQKLHEREAKLIEREKALHEKMEAMRKEHREQTEQHRAEHKEHPGGAADHPAQ